MENIKQIIKEIIEIVTMEGFVFFAPGMIVTPMCEIGLDDLADKYSFLFTYWKSKYDFIEGYDVGEKSSDFNLKLGLESVFEELLKDNCYDDIVNFLKRIPDSFNSVWIESTLKAEFKQLQKLYKLMGIKLSHKKDVFSTQDI